MSYLLDKIGTAIAAAILALAALSAIRWRMSQPPDAPPVEAPSASVILEGPQKP